MRALDRFRSMSASVTMSSLALALLVAATGCQTTTTKSAPESVLYYRDPTVLKEEKPKYFDAAATETHDDIRQIVTYWPEPIFLTISEVPVGLRATVVFVSGQTEKGAFVPGIIHVWLYESNERGSFANAVRPVYEWQFDEQKAMNWRIRRVNRLGNTYGLLLEWPRDLDLEGKRVRVEIGYERLDGSIVRNRPRTVDVPIGPDYQERRDAHYAGVRRPGAAPSVSTRAPAGGSSPVKASAATPRGEPN